MREDMNEHPRIPGTDEAWDNEELGADEKYVARLSEDELASDEALIGEALGLQPISIRLEKSLIEDFKLISSLHGLGYQTLMRQALKRFADCEKKRILREVAEHKVSASSPRAEPQVKAKIKKAA